MHFLKRTTSTAVALAALVGTAALAGASPAAAADYRCTTSTKSIDDPSYSGPWADNWNVTVRLCARHSGSTVSTYAKINWDGPVYSRADDRSIFDGAYFTLQVKKSVSGTDPVKKSVRYYGIESRLENSTSNGNYNNSYTTPVLSSTISSGKGLADGELHLDWNSDGRSYWKYQFSASPAV
ncbi:hypothetical protein [Streptomyces pseudovenezuelae]|uniref:hypothetical protein n=1 Tax=Streptomyces pseudovenezuelae TaxID=67350 RepID=UPI002E809367|nr:hypothetical protein [Streptomyces pseudovenezuelae]WUA87587.1 hypothetical protein OHO81_09950 [Streptomyces pseudovenezuelae]